jgi:hypothetical protein
MSEWVGEWERQYSVVTFGRDVCVARDLLGRQLLQALVCPGVHVLRHRLLHQSAEYAAAHLLNLGQV